MKQIINRYLKILGVSQKKPSIEYLSELLKAHITKIPFENISKLYYYATIGLQTIPDFETYLRGIEQNNFGGTCYSNNYYFNQLLNHLGFRVWLCGADMSEPDVHLVNIVHFGNKKYIADVGYGAPFFNPIPIDLNVNYNIKFGNDKYVLLPKNSNGYSELKQYRDDKLKHGYFVKPRERSFDEFDSVIKDSFRKTSTFLNRTTIIKFYSDTSVSIRNFSLIKIQNGKVKKSQLKDMNHMIEQIVHHFSIPKQIVEKSVNSINIS